MRQLIHSVMTSCAFLLMAMPIASLAQTQTSGAIVGAVKDQSGAIVPGATVDVLDVASNNVRSVVTNASGQYTVPNLPPGEHRITVSLSGFQKTVLTVKVEVTKSVLADIVLRLGDLSETLEVKGSSQMDLQTIDSSVGNVVSGESMVLLPTTQRRASELLYLQVGAQPNFGTGVGTRGGGVAGARSDQNTFTLDGIDISEPQGGGLNGQIGPGMLVPVDAVEEFRATSSNANATFGRSAGGQFAFTTRRGSNTWNGATYWYRQDDSLNANTWDRNRLGQAAPPLRDNRVGARLGGPIVRDKTFFFGFYEGRRFPFSTNIVRLVPTDSFRAGVLRFRDGQGNIVSYNLLNSTLCGPTSTSRCDPRGIGMSPLIADYMNHYPTGNSPSDGDGLNTIGFRGPVDSSQNNDITLGRVDHNLSAKWRLNGSFLWQRERTTYGAIGTPKAEFDPTLTGGKAYLPLSSTPTDPRNLAVSLAGEIKPTLFNDFHMGWTQTGIPLNYALPRLQITASGTPLDLAGLLLDDPGDPFGNGPQVARNRVWSWVNNTTWTTGHHAAQFGTSVQHLNFFHQRSEMNRILTVPLAQITAGNFIALSPNQRPPTCQGAQANCLLSADQARWNQLYGGMLGMVDGVTAFITRDAQGHALPPGTPLENDAKVWHTELYASDTWRISPSVTINYGLNFTIETPARDTQDRQAFVIDLATGQPVNPKEYLDKKEAAALAGRTYNPLIGFLPATTVGRSIYDTLKEPAPRFAMTWQPSGEAPILKTLLGDRKTVLRGGYALMFDRLIMANPIQLPLQGNANLAQTISTQAPVNASGDPFRVGVDGPVPALNLPTGTIALPFVPSLNDRARGTPFGIATGTAFDPNYKLGHTHSVNFTAQRELFGLMIVEVGWLGRYGRDLPARMDLNSVPYMIKDMSGLSGQTFADAFNAVATQLRQGVPAQSVTPQPWFENNLGASGTATLAAAATTNFVSGQLGGLFANQIDPRLLARGLPTVTSQQFQQVNYFTYGGWSNYNAVFVSVHKRPTHGLSFDLNYTRAHYRDTGAATASGGRFTDSFNPAFDYGDALSDRRHSLALYGAYLLPFARSNPVLGGWYTSFICSAYSGLPINVSQGNQVFGFQGLESVPLINSGTISGSVNYGVPGSGGVGTAGNPSNGGTGVNLFSDPQGVFRNFRPILLGVDQQTSRGAVRGPGIWNLDASVGKTFRAADKIRVNVSADFFNILNHVLFVDPSLSILNPAAFGVMTAQTGNPNTGDFSGPRRVQLGLRLEF